ERALLEGDERTGVTIMRVTAGLDSGPVALTDEIAIEPSDDYASVSAKLAALGGELLVQALDALSEGSLEFVEQDESEATYAEKVNPHERHLQPSRPAPELERVVRALGPHIGVHLEIADGERLGVKAAEAVADGPAPGEIEERDGRLLLGCADGALSLEV